MKLVCTADWHVYSFQEFSKQLLVSWENSTNRFVVDPNGKEMNSRLFNILDGICDIRDFCIEHDIKYILNAGDIFHKRGVIQVEAFNALCLVLKSIKDSNLTSIMVAGNHDQVDSSISPETSIHTLDRYATVIESPQVLEIDGISIICLPYSSNREFFLNSLYSLMGNIDSTKSIICAHCGVTGAQVGSGSFLMNDEYCLEDLKYDKFKYVVLGHYHRPQLLSNNTFYCGSPLQNSFSDELPVDEFGGHNGFFVIDTERRWNVEFFPIFKPRFCTVKSPEEITSDTDFFRLKTTSEEVILAESKSENVRIELEKSYEEVSRSEIDITDSFESAVTKYALEHNQSQDVVELGLNILNQAKQMNEV